MSDSDRQRPALTVDLAVRAGGRILLVERARDPFAGAWALPGGFVDAGERVEAAARRELAEETALDLDSLSLELLGVYDTPGRDPRGWTVSVVYRVLLEAPREVRGGDDASDARWWRREELPRLAFDHALIIRDAFERDARTG